LFRAKPLSPSEPFGSLPVAEESRVNIAAGSLPLTFRIFLLTILLAGELALLTTWLFHTTQVVATQHDWAALFLRSVVCFVVIVAPFGYLRNRPSIEAINAQSRGASRIGIRWHLLAAHLATLILAVHLSTVLYQAGGLRTTLLSAIWIAVWSGAFSLACLAFLSWPVWVGLTRRTFRLWIYASIAVIFAIASGPYLQRWFWGPGLAVRWTFRLVRIFLSPFVPLTIVDASTARLGTEHFRVEIMPACSGVEGIGMVLAFVTLWLIVFRKEYRFPRSLLLVPLGAVLIFLFNAVRIAALIFIGESGAEDIALNGFHSQAGWIAFSVVSVGFCAAIQWVPWFSSAPPGRELSSTTQHNPSAAYLIPFLAILAASMIAGAFKGTNGLEWLYPLRFAAAAAALWIFRRSYAGLNWEFDWLAPATGACVFLIWIAFDRSISAASDAAISSALSDSSSALRGIWLVLRVLAAVATVPLAEELAFRGFLMRRLVSARFECVSLRNFNWFAVLVSSLIFGFLHGGFWIAGSIAGILFALVTIRRGRIGEAVMAHATANALLAAYVIAFHKWHLW
jgi:exosortase E/protease (VPEID-CTERM system)